VHWFLWLALEASFLCGCLGDMGLVSDTEWEHTLQSTELENNWLALHPRAGEGGLGALCLSVRVYTGKQISDFFFFKQREIQCKKLVIQEMSRISQAMINWPQRLATQKEALVL
jgi:hypothetical protein